MYDPHGAARIVQLTNTAQDQQKLADRAHKRARRATRATTKAIRQHRAARRDLATLRLNPHAHGIINTFERREAEHRTTMILSAAVATRLVNIAGMEKAKAYETATTTMKAAASLVKERKAELNLYSTTAITVTDTTQHQEYDPPVFIKSTTLTDVARNWINMANGTTTTTTHPSGRHRLPGFRPSSQEEDALSSFRRQREFRTSADEQSSSSDDDNIITNH
jgi:hypothetical protein